LKAKNAADAGEWVGVMKEAMKAARGKLLVSSQYTTTQAAANAAVDGDVCGGGISWKVRREPWRSRISTWGW
jgi:hypothetical protein